MTLRPAEIELLWGDGEHRFRLAAGEVEELEAKLNIGALRLLRIYAMGEERMVQTREILRIALNGGGATPTETTLRMRRYFDQYPLWPGHRKIAMEVLTAAFIGPDGQDFPKADAQATDAPNQSARTASSISPASTDGAASSDSLPENSVISASGNSPSLSTDTSAPTTAARTSRRPRAPKITTVLLNSIPPPGGSIEDALREAMKE